MTVAELKKLLEQFKDEDLVLIDGISEDEKFFEVVADKIAVWKRDDGYLEPADNVDECVDMWTEADIRTEYGVRHICIRFSAEDEDKRIYNY